MNISTDHIIHPNRRAETAEQQKQQKPRTTTSKQHLQSHDSHNCADQIEVQKEVIAISANRFEDKHKSVTIDTITVETGQQRDEKEESYNEKQFKAKKDVKRHDDEGRQRVEEFLQLELQKFAGMTEPTHVVQHQ